MEDLVVRQYQKEDGVLILIVMKDTHGDGLIKFYYGI